MLTEIGISLHPQPSILWSDNLGAQALAKNPVYHAQTKHIELDAHFICTLISDRKLEVQFIPTAEQPADLLTKALSSDRFQLLCHKLTMAEPLLRLRGPVEVTAATHEPNQSLLNKPSFTPRLDASS